MTRITAIDRAGLRRQLDTTAEQSLMELLRDADLGLAAVCGGTMSCGTCHVYVNDAGAAQLPLPVEDELALLSLLSHCREGSSRLACQIQTRVLTPGFQVTVAPEE